MYKRMCIIVCMFVSVNMSTKYNFSCIMIFYKMYLKVTDVNAPIRYILGFDLIDKQIYDRRDK